MNKTKAVRIKKTDNQLVKLTAVNSGTTIRKTLEGMILKSYVKHINVISKRVFRYAEKILYS